MDYYIGPKNLISVCNLVAELGHDPGLALQMTEISADELGKPDVVFPSSKLFDLMECAARITGRKDFGLYWGSLNDFHRMGPIAAYLKISPSISTAVNDGSRFLTAMNWGIRSSVREVGGLLSRFELEILQTGKFPPHQYLESLMIALVPLWNELLGTGWRPTEVWFLHLPIAGQDVYEKAFRCPVKFGQRANAIVAPTADFQTRKVLADTQAQIQVHALIQEEDKVDQERFLAQVAEALRRLIPQHDANIVRIARELSMSTTVFQRRLDQARRTLKSLVTEVRLATFAAVRKNGVASNAQIMKAIGIRDPSTFAKFVKQHADTLALPQEDVGKMQGNGQA